MHPMRKQERYHQFDPVILREYDIRGVVDQDLTTEDAYAVGQGFASLLTKEVDQPTICLGYDGRLTSPDLMRAVRDGLISCGAHVLGIGCGPTPMLYYAVKNFKADGGLMVTGSHNPPAHNGFKMALQQRSFYGQDIKDLAYLVEKGQLRLAKGSYQDRPIQKTYVNQLAEAYSFDQGLKVIWDPGNGAAGACVTELIKLLPGNHKIINGTIDGTFPSHHPDPTVVENLHQIQQEIITHQFDLGIAFDGDADRIGIVDDQGQVLWADQMICLLARDVLRERPGSMVIADVKSSQTLFDEVTRLGGEAMMWKTGHSLLKAKMAEEGAPLAGEMSGHIFFADHYYGFDDGLYVAIRFLNFLMRDGRKLSKIRKELPEVYNTPELRFDCPEEEKFKLVNRLCCLLQTDGKKVNTIDGARVQEEEGWWLVRASNTQPVIVVRCEALSQVGLNKVKHVARDYLVRCGLGVPVF